jgi:hypothetical protein
MLLWLEQCIEIPEATKGTETMHNVRYIWNLMKEIMIVSIRYVIFKLSDGVVSNFIEEIYLQGTDHK